MYHSLLIAKGDIKTLCNGRPPFNKDGSGKNRYTGSSVLLVRAMQETEDSNRKKYLIPQNLLHHKIDCKKCKSLQGTRKDRAKSMKFVYRNSPTYQNKVSSEKTLKYGIHMDVLGASPTKRYRKVLSPPWPRSNRTPKPAQEERIVDSFYREIAGKTLRFQISVV